MERTNWQEERQHLKEIYQNICREIEKREGSMKAYRQHMLSTRRTIWEDIPHNWQAGDFDAAVEVKQYLDGLKQDTHMHHEAAQQVEKLHRLKESAYFGRMDFMEEDTADVEQIYIGIQSFFDKNGDILIYDWRAPISSIFYDYELGLVKYRCLDGIIEGHVDLKRQYRITEDTLHYMLDTGLKIDDELLQEILSKNVDEKMRNIVNTIQKEQNRIIRDETHQVLMVQGAAGSGKTSIALHRIAYLLYRYRDQDITARNILIFSPNAVFNDYISHVLPELGEENMQQTTFFEYLERMADGDYVVEDTATHMEFMLLHALKDDGSHRLEGIRYKASLAFKAVLDAYGSYLEHSLDFRDLLLGDTVLVSRDEIRKLHWEDYRYLPLARRLRKIKDRLYYLIRPAWRQRRQAILEEIAQHPDYKERAKAHARLMAYKEFRSIREHIEKMISFQVFDAYCALFEQPDLTYSFLQAPLPTQYLEICRETTDRLRQHILGYEDLAGLVYFKGLLEGVPNMSAVRHVVVDEAQDYTPVQYGILKQLFSKTRMTLLGDFNQAIHPLQEPFSYDHVREILIPGSYEVLELTRSYRSTLEIMAFTTSVLKEGRRIEPVLRSGPKPLLIQGRDDTDLAEVLAEDIEGLANSGMESIGIICKTAAASQRLHDRLRNKLRTVLLTKDDRAFIKGIVVLPVYLAKGLEFDAALVYGADDIEYGQDNDRRLFYTACTRALHRLHLYYTGTASPFINNAPEGVLEKKVR